MAGTVVATTTAGKRRGVVRVDVDLAITSSTTIAAAPIGSFYGRLVGVMTDGTAGAGTTMTTTADILLTDALTGAPILTDLSFATSDNYRPTSPVADNAGVAVTPATSAPNVNRDIFVGGRLNVAIANGTNGDSGRLTLLFEEA